MTNRTKNKINKILEELESLREQIIQVNDKYGLEIPWSLVQIDNAVTSLTNLLNAEIQ